MDMTTKVISRSDDPVVRGLLPEACGALTAMTAPGQCWNEWTALPLTVADQVANSAMRVARPNAFDVAVRNNWVVSEARAAPSSSCKAVTLVTKARKLSAG